MTGPKEPERKLTAEIVERSGRMPIGGRQAVGLKARR
jgi:hypothetical protein